jgi:hypothetical protein
LHRRLHRLDAFVSRSNGLRERGLEALISRDLLRVLLIGPASGSTAAIKGTALTRLNTAPWHPRDLARGRL